MKKGDKMLVVKAYMFKPDMQWLEGEIVEIDEILPSGLVKAHHPRVEELYFRPERNLVRP